MQTKGRGNRRDKGTIQITQRDAISLDWIAEQYAIRLDDLAILLGQIDMKDVSQEAARKVTERWIRAGLALSRKVQFNELNWIWLTRKGLYFVESEYGFFDPARSNLLSHIRNVNRVRMYVEKIYRAENIEWKSERAIQKGGEYKQRKRNDAHIVDGEIYLQGQVIGIEVELTPKDQLRLNTILAEITAAYESIWYFVTPQVTKPLVRALEMLDSEYRERVDIIPLSELECKKEGEE